MKKSTRISYILSNLISIFALFMVIYGYNFLGSEKTLEICMLLMLLSFCIAIFYSAIKRGLFYDNFDMKVSGGYSYKTGRYTVTYSKNSNTATVEEETESGGGYNWLWNLIVLLYHSSMVMFFGILIAFYDNEKNKLKSANIDKTQGALKIVKICVIYYFRFFIWCSGVGLTMYCLNFSFFGIIVIASIVLWRVIVRACKNV